jgi:hypothetical protein
VPCARWKRTTSALARNAALPTASGDASGISRPLRRQGKGENRRQQRQGFNAGNAPYHPISRALPEVPTSICCFGDAVAPARVQIANKGCSRFSIRILPPTVGPGCSPKEECVSHQTDNSESLLRRSSAGRKPLGEWSDIGSSLLGSVVSARCSLSERIVLGKCKGLSLMFQRGWLYKITLLADSTSSQTV